jgi:myo-inositol-1(or 4)-monophosphatase
LCLKKHTFTFGVIKNIPMKDLAILCEKTVEITKNVGEFIRQESLGFDLSKIEIKGMNDLVSYVDKEAEKALIEKLSQILPEAGYFTEEDASAKTITDKPYHWIIDPLDGTTNFLHGLPLYAISIGLMHENKMVMGVVYEINKDECFWAWKDGGAYCNGRKIQVSPVNQLNNSLLATGFPYRDFDMVPSYLNIIKDFMKHTHGLRRMGSAAVDLAYVAMGRFQGFFEYNLNAWDVAAGALIIQEAGGKVSTFKGTEDYVFGREIVASGNIQGQMLEVIGQHWN